MQAIQVGFLGLGRMGSAIAHRLTEAGVPLTVWNRSQSDSVEELLSQGASRAENAAQALAAPVSFSMLADDSAAEAVLSRVNIGRASGDRIHVNCASVSGDLADLLTKRFADAGVAYVAAPVLGRPDVAAAGRLNVLVAGSPAAVSVVEPMLATFSARRWQLGDTPRQANAVKTALNFMLLHALGSMGEAIALVEAEGIDSERFVELFTQTFFGGTVYSIYGKMMAERRYTPPGFTVGLGLKDLGLAEQLAARSNVSIPSADVLRGRFEAALADPSLADLDWSAVAEVGRKAAE
jgi:3-hydroxyisobutyrate dehydrogenase-like beta-hydroxyacid dehydrogenase